ncbi:hypothetical protein ACLI1A_16580 [Flavobacterium sp. RHBU_3]|uniref:hypothetical protein n=1 Tax=Flavobacterium sp. RHBU_3 TaxID=3391184 RepID=UPI003984D7EE
MNKLIYNPFEKFSEKQLFFSGSIALLIGSAIAVPFSARFDGIIDMHLSDTVMWWQPLADNLLNTLVLSALLFAIGKSINKGVRFIDVLNAALVSRALFYLLPLTNIGGYLGRATENIINAGADITKMDPVALGLLSVLGIVSMALLVWAMALLYHGYRVAANVKTTPQVLVFVAAVIAAEVISKLLIYNIPY